MRKTIMALILALTSLQCYAKPPDVTDLSADTIADTLQSENQDRSPSLFEQLIALRASHHAVSLDSAREIREMQQNQQLEQIQFQQRMMQQQRLMDNGGWGG